MSTHRYKTERIELADYLRRLADLVDKGEARGDVVVEIGEETRTLTAWNGDVGHMICRGAEVHTVTIESLRHIQVRKCMYCGKEHAHECPAAPGAR